MVKSYTFIGLVLTLTLISGGTLASSFVSADDSVVDEVSITVPVSCTMSGTGMNTHNTEITNGTYTANIGTTTLHAFCNDNEGFSIYAAGYTGDEMGGTNSNKLVGTSVSGNAAIESGLATSAGNPDISNWAMKLAITQDSGDITGTNAFVIDSAPNVDLPSEAEQSATQASFSEYHVVPNEYVKVAHKNSATDMTANTGGVKLTTTYAAYISKTQPADTYSGQVIYTLLHPASAEPFVPHEMSCEAETICYHTNVAPTETEGTMEPQSLTNKNKDWSSCQYTDYTTFCTDSNYQSIDINILPKVDYYTTNLTASDYSRSNYGFAGWNTAYDYSGTNYGPNETITIADDIAENGLSLYAIWVPVARDNSDNELTFQTSNLKTVTLKDGDTLNDKPNGYVTALRDIRDDDVYAIAKLADGQYWMIENLRLDNTANITPSNTQSNNGAWGGAFIGLADPEPSDNFYSYSIIFNSLYDDTNITGDLQRYRYPRYNNDNTTRISNALPYSYGNVYSWAAAAADTSLYDESGEFTIASTSICPSGWRLPIQEFDSNNGDYSSLHTSMDNSAYDSAASQNWRKYPNDYLLDSYTSSSIYNMPYGDWYTCSFLQVSSSAVTITRSDRYSAGSIRCIAQ